MNSLEGLIETKLKRAVDAVLQAFPENLDDYVDEILNFEPVRLFRDGQRPSGMGYLEYRNYGGRFLSQYTLTFASRFKKEIKGTEVKRYLQVSALDGTGNTAGIFIVPLHEVQQFIEAEKGGFVNFDDPTVQDGILQFLARRKITYGDMIYSHNEEKIVDGQIYAEDAPATLKPSGVVTYVLKEPRDEGATQKQIIADIGVRLLGKKAARNGKLDQLESELNKLFGVGEHYTSLYAALRHTRFFATTSEDIIRHAQAKGLSLLSYFNNPDGRTDGQKKRNGRLGLAQQEAIRAIEEVAAHYIEPPKVVIVTRTKSHEAFANKVLTYMYHDQIAAALNAKGSPLNKYLRGDGLPSLPRDMQRRDIRDLNGMKILVHGSSVTYDLNIGNYRATAPDLELKAQDDVYNTLFKLGEVPDNSRKDNKWRQLPAMENSDGVTINFGVPKDVEDYIKNPKKSGYRAIHVSALGRFRGLNGKVPFEVQIKTNFFDTQNEMYDRSMHRVLEAMREKVLEYLVISGSVPQNAMKAVRIIIAGKPTIAAQAMADPQLLYV